MNTQVERRSRRLFARCFASMFVRQVRQILLEVFKARPTNAADRPLEAQAHYIIRDFDRKQFEARKRKMMEIAKKVGKGLHPDCYIELVIEDSYYNMREKVVEHPHIIDIAQQAMRDCDIEPELKPIRGGTDGAQLSFMGLPCPNLFTGGYNYHGKHEFVTLEGMEKAVQVIVRIAELTAQRKS